MNVCVVGGGHIGTTLSAYIKQSYPEYSVKLMTRRPERFGEAIKVNDIEGGFSYDVALDAISADSSIAAAQADIVFIALPHFAIEKAFSDIASHVAEGAFVGVIPGSGGSEFFFERYFGDRAHMFGFQRVPFTAKLVEYGHETNLKSWKPFSVVGTLKKSDLEEACLRVERCGLKTEKAANYLAVSLTPSNPVLHTARTHDIFGAFSPDHEFSEWGKFYVGWTDDASRTMLAVDDELHRLFDAIPELDMSSVLPLVQHYEAPTVEAMTEKINSIPTFQTVMAPMKPSPCTDGAFVADTSSRLFTEDFPWGLCVIRAYCEIFGVASPTIDGLLQWYQRYMGVEYFVGGKFAGKDLAQTGIPQNHGITTPSQVLALFDA